MHKDYDPPLFITIPVTSSAQMASVYALLGRAVSVALTVNTPIRTQAPAEAEYVQPNEPDTAEVLPETVGMVDTAGWAWDAALHASTKGTTKEGLWRMKIGVSRPDPKPGFPKEIGHIGAQEPSTAHQASATATDEPVTSTVESTDDDEFAAFRKAADKTNDVDEAAAATIPARKWTDQDLGALCNQAAGKLGDPVPVKTLIADFVPEGAVPHSRNIPVDAREAFAKAVELKAGIEFAG